VTKQRQKQDETEMKTLQILESKGKEVKIVHLTSAMMSQN